MSDNVIHNYVKCLVGAHVLFIRDGKVFLIRRTNTGFGDGLYSVPAGHVDDGELIPQSAIREAKEEAGVTIDPASLVFAHVVHMRKQNPEELDRMQVFFACMSWEGEPQNLEPTKCDHADWFPLDALPPNMVKYTAQALEGFQNGIHFSHLDE